MLRKFGFAIVILGLLVGVILMLTKWQTALIFYPEKLSPDHPFKFARPFEERTLEVSGDQIHSLYFQAQAPRALVLYFHGNAGSLDSWGDVAGDLVQNLNVDVWIMDYPGYGKSSGAITGESQLNELAQRFLAEAKAEARSKKLPLFVYARSIGTGLAVRAVAEDFKKLARIESKDEKPVAGLILESPYESLTRLAREIFPWVPSFLLQFKFQSDEYASIIGCKTLIVHGVDDGTIPIVHGRDLAKKFTNAELAEIRAGGHNDLSNYPEYWRALEDFTNETLKAE